MALKTFNPTTLGQRQLVLVDRSALYKGKPVKTLTEGKTGNGGRNNNGRITVRFRSDIATVTRDALLRYCNERLGKVQRLTGIELRSELPKNAIGKILKRELRAPYWETPVRSAHDAV